MKLRAQEILSPNADGKFDTAAVEVSSNVSWKLFVGQHLIQSGQGDAQDGNAIQWGGTGTRGDGTTGVLDHGQYSLRLTAPQEDLEDEYATVAVDLKGPETSDINFEQGKIENPDQGIPFKGNTTLKEVGYSEVDQPTIKVTADGKDVTHQFDSSSGNLTFEGRISEADAADGKVRINRVLKFGSVSGASAA